MARQIGYLLDFIRTFFNWMITIALGFKVGFIAIQASKRKLSRFNTSTKVSATPYSPMSMTTSIAMLATGYIKLGTNTKFIAEKPLENLN